MNPTPFLSIIIPAHNEESRLPAALDKLAAYLADRSLSAEVLVVENGSTDHTLALAQEYAADHPWLRVIQEERSGKGRAVQRGVLAAQGAYRFIADVDFSMPVEQIDRFIPPQLPEFDIAIASREAAGAVRYDEPPYRHFIGRVFNSLVRVLALPGLQDTQCGFKCFRGEVAERIFPLQTVMGWTFDVEVLFIARRHGYRIVEIGIPWYHDRYSKVRVFKDSLKMGLDLLSIRWNGLRGRYDPK